MLDQEQVRRDILAWSEHFIEVPHPALGGWPPCPYARSARLKNTVAIFTGMDPYYDLKNRSQWGMGQYEVIVYAYDPAEWTYELFSASISQANEECLLRKDMLALEDHPSDPEIVNGVSMNQGTYAMALVQKLSDLNDKAKQLANKGFYHSWPESYLRPLFTHRKDPRS